MSKIHLKTIARLQRQVTQLEEELECAMQLKKRLAKLQEQFDAAVKLCYHWENKCQMARQERDKAIQGVKYDDGTLSCETIIKHMTNGSLEINSRFIGGGGGGVENE